MKFLLICVAGACCLFHEQAVGQTEVKAFLITPENPSMIKAGIINSKPILIVMTHNGNLVTYRTVINIIAAGIDFTIGLNQQHVLENNMPSYWAYSAIELGTMLDPKPGLWNTALQAAIIKVTPEPVPIIYNKVTPIIIP